MAQRYVRVQNPSGQLYYGVLQLDRTVQVLDAPPWLGGQLTEQFLEADQFTLLAPCAPSKIVAIGKNYARHAAEMGTPVPDEPLIFMKPPTTVIPTGAAIHYPPQTQQIDYEGELALVMGDRCFCCSPEDALSKIWGYTIAIDVTARDLQQRDVQWVRAKGFDTFCPLGPWIVRELSAGAMLQTFLNEQPKPVQSAPISDMVVSPEQLVSYISQVLTLMPGDVILTGTPDGVGPLSVGDTVRVEVEGIGSLESQVILRPNSPSTASSDQAIAP
jgi:2-keto-4-pentenoate hydratase/2-oxohepta-3-ene-1,7-dioic acid hydratase in catechol pathway